MNIKIIKNIYKEHLKVLKNLNIDNKNKLLICFSGIPRSGKTTIAKKIERDLKAVRISNDLIRDIINNKFKNVARDDIQEILEDYLIWLLEELEKFSNNLIVLDSSIDRKYKKVFYFANKFKFKTFIIKIEIGKDEFKKRIKNKKEYLDGMNKWYSDYLKFNKINKNNYFIKNSQIINWLDLYEQINYK